MTFDRLESEINHMMGGCMGKVTFSKKIGRRNEFIFACGVTQYQPAEIIWEDENYIVFAEALPKEVEVKVRKILEVTYA